MNRSTTSDDHSNPPFDPSTSHLFDSSRLSLHGNYSTMILTSASIALLLGVCPLAAEGQTAKWHPTFSVGWADGYCRYTTENNSPGYSTQLACCKSAYAGQVSGYCLSTLPAPPTTSPTTTGNLLEVWYPGAYRQAGTRKHNPSFNTLTLYRPTQRKIRELWRPI